MPYIKPEIRSILDQQISNIITSIKEKDWTPGDLNYIITKICLSYINEPSYKNYNEVIGVLECVKQELYRRKVAPYEDKKRDENGEVY